MGLLISVHNPSKSRHGPDNGVVFHAKGDSKMTRTHKAAAGNDQDQFFLEGPHKGHIIGDGCFGKKIECTWRCNKIISAVPQTVTQQIPFTLVLGHIHAHALHFRHHALHQRRGIDKADDAIGQGHGVHQVGSVGSLAG